MNSIFALECFGCTELSTCLIISVQRFLKASCERSPFLGFEEGPRIRKATCGSFRRDSRVHNGGCRAFPRSVVGAGRHHLSLEDNVSRHFIQNARSIWRQVYQQNLPRAEISFSVHSVSTSPTSDNLKSNCYHGVPRLFRVVSCTNRNRYFMSQSLELSINYSILIHSCILMEVIHTHHGSPSQVCVHVGIVCQLATQSAALKREGERQHSAYKSHKHNYRTTALFQIRFQKQCTDIWEHNTGS
mmetsp:Transcript_110325/g.306794  ORF Transcript_110325/g.306794 Transcript_110325/m.306794 type:complete len:244 (-) Transcript_110325:63-794(-)